MSWVTAPGKYFGQYRKVEELCGKNIGPQFKETTNKLTGRKSNNHGNWRLTFEGTMQFRYKKDLIWFLLVAGELKDCDPVWKWVTK